MCMKIMDDLSENAAARKGSCKKGTFFIWAGIDFPLHDDDKQKEEEEDKEEKEQEEEEEEKEEEKEEDEDEVNVTNKYK